MQDFVRKEKYNIADLVEIMRLLRAPEGCPWDREQTHESIRQNVLEEAYEVCEAIDAANPAMMREELGDLLLQVVFHARISEEAGGFDLTDVADGVCQKLVMRHPHIFGDAVAETSEDVLRHWDAIKKKEKGQTTASQTLESVPKTFPALMRSDKVQSRARKAGFDYTDPTQAMNDLQSELAELQQAMASGVAADIEEEMGDLLFSCVNVARMAHVDPELALTRSCDKFVTRFTETERLAAETGLDLKSASFEEMDALWKQAKKNLAK